MEGLPSSAVALAPAPISPSKRWLPLESSPDVFNQRSTGVQLMWSLGVPEDVVEFHDMYSLDADALEMVPKPMLVVVFCFPDPPQKIRLREIGLSPPQMSRSTSC
ncbi:hypothetical protein E2562_024459 [Oryza meyeriana var. granulata]|uniref:ubiquitinyl hydrolase 1 n=1 Tax=Oryza meyeriana var. granulata TaxID=110450 RepID=A0A6G1EYT3_9ORYZ|nr:hypothetical protein E2562_024459 [Oryza meyeriana var. granulata]